MSTLIKFSLFLIACGWFSTLSLAETSVFRATIADDGIQYVEIVGGEYYFKPQHIVVKQGVPVVFKYKKTVGLVPHNMLLHASDNGIDFDVKMTSDWQTLHFTPTGSGKFEISCNKKLLWFKSHKEKGMRAVLEVVP